MNPLRRPAIATLALVLGVLAYQAWCWNLGRLRLAGLDLPPHGAVSVRIDLPFQPEAFNITRLQNAGRLVRLDGTHAWLRDVPVAQLRALAREYWIGRVSAWNPA